MTDSHVYAVVEAGTVTNVIVASAEFAGTIPGTHRIDHLDPRPGVGWALIGRTWTAPPETGEPGGPGYHPFPT